MSEVENQKDVELVVVGGSQGVIGSLSALITQHLQTALPSFCFFPVTCVSYVYSSFALMMTYAAFAPLLPAGNEFNCSITRKDSTGQKHSSDSEPRICFY